MRRRFATLPALALLVLLASQCKQAPPAAATTGGTEPLATVAGRPITAADLVAEAERRRASRQPVPGPEQLLEEMIQRAALVERARRAGLEQEPATRHRMESVLIARLRERDLDEAVAKLTVGDDEVRHAYESRQQEFSRKGMDRFAILFQALPEKKSEARRNEARQRLSSALAVADANPAPGGRGPAASGFGAVAIDHSDDQISRYRGGDVGWIESDAAGGRLPETVLQAGRALAKGKRSEILDGGDGLYVIMKTDSRPGGVRPFEEVADRLRQVVLLEKRRALEQRFAADSLAAVAISRNPEAARKVSLPAPATPATEPAEPPAFPGIDRPSASR